MNGHLILMDHLYRETKRKNMIATVYEKGRLKKYFMHGPQFKDLNSIGKKS